MAKIINMQDAVKTAEANREKERHYKPATDFCDVLMRDFNGHHRVNDSFFWDVTPKQIAKKYGFEFAADSIQINGFPVSDEMMDVTLRKIIGQEKVLLSYRRNMRLAIMGTDLSQYRKLKPAKNSGTSESAESEGDSK